ncbi:2-hydroxyacid dehydrogenase [Virgibacillus sp. W0181]|uniref:2-hydroxyacid dehydrogenase n=1 Tax=Virgibacillus sp. W0181 TaxID=3391581 RepID=UPI003F46603C
MQKSVIYITRKIPRTLVEPYEDTYEFRMWDKADEPVPRDVLVTEAKNADGLLCLLSEKIDADFLDQVPNLKIVANMAVGFDNIDVNEAKKRGIVVTNTPDVLTETTADLTFALLMATARRITEASDYIKQDQWNHWSPFMLAGSDIHHKTIGIVGMGRIGEAVARRAKGFGMKVKYYNRSRKPNAEQELDATYLAFDELLETADFVVSLVPLTAESKQIFNKEAFEKMKRSAIFINASRGGVVDEAALIQALENKEITAAGLDVFEKEPISADHPLMKLENAVCLPHIGSASTATREDMISLCFKNIAAVLTGDEPLTPVN